MKTLTSEEKRKLVDWEDAAGFNPVASQELFMDNHGYNVVLMVVQCEDQEDDNRLYGFTYRYSSEDISFEDDPVDLVPVKGREVIKVEYDREDGDEWSDHV